MKMMSVIMPILFYLTLITFCACTGGSESNDLVVKSYFGKGFGRLITEKVILKSDNPSTSVSKQTIEVKPWHAFKPDGDQNIAGGDSGIIVRYFTKNLESEVEKNPKIRLGQAVTVIGYETIYVNGEPSLSSEVGEEGSELLLHDQSWTVERILEIRKVYFK